MSGKRRAREYWEYAELFDQADPELDEAWRISPMWARVGQMRYRVKTIESGDIREALIYPAWGRAEERRARQALKQGTPERQRRYEDRQSVEHFVRLLNTNFGPEDIHLTLTYQGTPPNWERGAKDVRNYLRRVKRERVKRGLPEMKYVKVQEDQEDGELKRMHHHLVISGGISREELEKLWGKGYANADRLQPTEEGLRALGVYLLKNQRQGRYARRWQGSRNLKQPKVRISNSKLSTRRVRELARDFEGNARRIVEAVYPGWRFVSGEEPRYSDVVSGVYLRVTLRRESSARTMEATEKKVTDVTQRRREIEETAAGGRSSAAPGAVSESSVRTGRRTESGRCTAGGTRSTRGSS